MKAWLRYIWHLPSPLRSRWVRWPATAFVLWVLLFSLLDALMPLRVAVPYARGVYARDGTLLGGFLASDQRWRLRLAADEIPLHLRTALLAKEDRYYYWHPGINPLAIGRALYQNLSSQRRASGASTLSMQVVRMLKPKERSYAHKLLEMWQALQLEWHHSKDEILELYLTLAPYGSNIEGVKAASYLFFRKPPAALSLAEATTLVVVPNRPNSLALGRHNAEARKARDRWLSTFAQEGVFTQEEVDRALNEPLEVRRHPMPTLAPHLANRLARHYPRMVDLHTTLDAELQQRLGQLTYQYMRRLRPQGITNAAVLVLDNETREVRAYIGSADYRNVYDQGQVDGVVAVRSPGSTLKPFCYAWAMDRGLITPLSTVPDVPTNLFGYQPENYDDQYHGNVTIAYALAQSLNIPAVRIMQQLGQQYFIDRLAGLGFRQIGRDRERLGLSMILGGCGVRLEELVGLYGALAARGDYLAPRYLSNGAVLPGQRVFSREASYLTGHMLTQLVRPDLPTAYANTTGLPRIAWKTGTSYGRRDAWAIGYSGRYTVGVWVGNFNGRGHPQLNGSEVATPLLFELFTTLSPGENLNWLRPPLLLARRRVCARSGLPPGPRCTEKVHDHYLPGISPNQKCTCRQTYWVNDRETMSYCTRCLPAVGYHTHEYDHFPSALTAWYLAEGIPIDAPPPHNPACSRLLDDDEALRITSPREGAEYIIDRLNPRKMALECAAPPDANRLHWFVDGRYYRQSTPGEAVFFSPDTGLVRITVNDDKGRKHSVRFRVKAY